MPQFPETVHPIQSSFSRGEVSPFLFGRVDLAGWAQGLRTLRNATVRPEGAVSNRQGFNFNGNSLTNTPLASILVPFIFSATQSYVIEIGNLTAQVFSSGQIVNTVAATITTAIFQLVLGPPPRVYIKFTTSAPHGLSIGQNINISGVVGTGDFALINGPNVVAGSLFDATHFAVPAITDTGVYSSGGSVGVSVSFVTPWAAADLPALRWSQSADTLTLVHTKYPPYEIKRTSATSFTCLQAVYNNGPFLQQNADGVTFVFASATSGTVILTSTAPIFNANHVGALFQLTQQDLSNIQPWEPSKQLGTVTGLNATPIYRRASLKNYKSTSAVHAIGADTVTTGTWIPAHSQGTQADGDGGNIPNLGFGGVNWEYQDSGFGIVKITAFTDSQHVTGVVQPNYTGGPGLLPTSVVGGPQVAFGPFSFSGNGVLTSFGPLTGNTSQDPSKFYVTIGGVYQPPSLYSISATGGGNIVFLSPPPTGTNNIVVEQISLLGQTTFWAFGAFSADQGYPGAVSYFPDRLVLAGTKQQPVGVFASKTSIYHDFGVSNPVVASDGMAVFLNARQLNAITDLIPLSDLLVGTSNILWRLWPGATGTALSPLAVAATPQNYYGDCPTCAGLLFSDSGIFAEFDGRRIRDLIYQFAFDKFMGQELTLYSRHLIPFKTTFKRLAYKPDPSGQLVFGLLSNGNLIVCTYLREQQIIGWGRFDTQGTFEDIVVVPEEGRYDLYAITNRTIGGQTVRYIEQMESREVSTIFDYQFLDCNTTYDGRNTSAATMTLSGGTTWLAGDVGTLTASTATGWTNFFASDVTNGNEIWIQATLNFLSSVGGMLGGVLTVAVTPGVYQVMFSDGETRSVTIAADGITASWQQPLANGSLTSCQVQARLLITSFTSATVVSVRFKDPVPAMLRSIATLTWTFARTNFSNATQIAGQNAVAYADGQVFGIKSTGVVPDGTIAVSAVGAVTFPRACGVVQLGLPYLSDFETLPLNVQGMETIRERAKTEPVIYLDVTETRNFLAGTDFSTLSPHCERTYESYVAPTAIQQGVLWTRFASTLDSECHTCIRQNMPLPITIRAVIPEVGVGQPIS